MISRRSLIGSIAAGIVCAPAIVRASSLMPVKVWEPITPSADMMASGMWLDGGKPNLVVVSSDMIDQFYKAAFTNPISGAVQVRCNPKPVNHSALDLPLKV